MTGPFDDSPADDRGSNRVKKSELDAFLIRIDRLEVQREEVNDSIKEVKAEAKSRGYDMKAFNAILALRKKDKETRELIHVYGDVLGVFG